MIDCLIDDCETCIGLAFFKQMTGVVCASQFAGCSPLALKYNQGVGRLVTFGSCLEVRPFFAPFKCACHAPLEVSAPGDATSPSLKLSSGQTFLKRNSHCHPHENRTLAHKHVTWALKRRLG